MLNTHALMKNMDNGTASLTQLLEIADGPSPAPLRDQLI